MDGVDRHSFDLGWDFATFRMEVPDQANRYFCDGYRAFLHGNNKTTHRPDKFIRKWLQIRLGALRRGKEFSLDVTPQYIQSITPASGRCPVTGLPLTFAAGIQTDWSIDRANNDRGYVRGNIIVLSVAANAAKGNKSLDEIRILSSKGENIDGLTPDQWHRLAILIEPAFGQDDSDMNPVQVLLGQPIALGMPVSPIACLQVSLARAIIMGWDTKKRDAVAEFLFTLHNLVVMTKPQQRAMRRLELEIFRRSRHIRSYTEIWATRRAQKRLAAFIETLGSSGIKRLIDLQELTMGNENVNIA